MRTGPVAAAKKARGWALTLLNAPNVLGNSYQGTDKMVHGYLPYYRSQFRHLRLRQMVVFEIGVGGHEAVSGGSLQLWRDYFARSTIVGIDIERKDIAFGPRVKFEQADQNSPADLQRVVAAHGRPTIVIDDGSHVGEHIHTSFACLWPQLVAGGVYVIEDLVTSYDPAYGGAIAAPASSAIGLVQALASDTQIADPVHAQDPSNNRIPTAQFFSDVAGVSVFPGIAFIHKSSSSS